MGVISLKFSRPLVLDDSKRTNENFASLSVNDHVYFVETNTRGDYVINSNTANYLGAVKKIINSRPPITRTFTLDRDHYTNFTINNGSVDGNVGHDRLDTGHDISYLGAIDPDLETFLFQGGANHGRIAKKGDIVTFAAGQGSLSSLTRTISGFANINQKLHYNLNDNITSAGVTFSNVEFTTTSPNFKKVGFSLDFSTDIGGIEVGDFVSGGNLPGGGTPTTIVNSISNNVISLSNTAISTGSSTVNLTFSKNQTITTEPFEIQIHIDNDDVTLPVHSNNPYYFFIKDTSVNTSGLLGYYSEVQIKNASTDKAELFSIGSEIFESSK